MRTAEPSAARSIASDGVSKRLLPEMSRNRSLSALQEKTIAARAGEATRRNVTIHASLMVPGREAAILNPMRIVTSIALVLLLACAAALAQPVKYGVDVLRDDHFKMLEGKRVGLVANPASVDSNLVNTATLLSQAKNVKLVALFGPEHGIWGDEYAGHSINDRTDPHTGLPGYSIFGKAPEPTTRM